MHQTFYIDVDEEITSVIDRLRKSKTKENIFVAPKASLMLQSIVNLKLLKKEADKLKRQIMIVSQDPQGQMLSEKVGILVQPTLEGMDESEQIKEDFQPNIRKEENVIIEPKRKINRVDDIGSESFFEKARAASVAMQQKIKIKAEVKKVETVKPVLEEEKISGKGIIEFDPLPPPDKKIEVPPEPVESTEKKEEIMVDNPKEESGENSPVKISVGNTLPFEREKKKFFSDVKAAVPSAVENDDYKHAKKLQDFFQPPSGDYKITPETLPKTYASAPSSGRMRKFFILLGAIVLLAAIFGTAAYFALPKAKIGVHLQSKNKDFSLDVKGDASASSSNIKEKIVPLKIVEEEKEEKQSFQTTGKSNISDQKARGTVVIYNEYSASYQPLIATTRLLSTQGKLFRLVKDVTVPGMTKVGSELKPGAMEAEVIADQTGEEYNIDSSDFSIPGFQGTPKYEKFSAKSSKAMAGGGKTGTGLAAVSKEDFDGAKGRAEDAIIQKIKEEIRNQAGEDEILLNEAVDKTVTESVCSPEAGTVSETIECRVKMKVTAMIFSQNYIKEMINQALNDAKKDGDPEFSTTSTNIDYTAATPDFKNKILLIKAQANVSLLANVDLEKLRRELMGKNENQIKEVLKSYPQVETIEVDLWPKFFVNKIPTRGNRVEIRVK